MKKSLLISMLTLISVFAYAQDRFYSFTGNVDNDYFTGNDGTINGTVTYIADRFGTPNAAINIGGSGSNVTFGIVDSLNGKNDITIAGWFQKAPAGTQRAMFGNGPLAAYLDIGGGALNAYNSCTVPLANAFVTISASNLYTSISVGQWYHYALVLRGGYMSTYINGKLYGYASFTSPTCATPGSFKLGQADAISTANNWLGGVDDLFLFGKGLTSTQVDSLYNLPNPCSASISFTQHPNNVVITSNSTVTFSANSNGFGLTYLWQISRDGGKTFTDLSNDAIYSNVNTTTLSVNAVDTLNNYQYRLRASDGTCALTSNAASIRYPVKVSWSMDSTMVSTTGTNPFTILSPNSVGPSFVADRFGNPNKAFNILNNTQFQHVTTSGLDFLSNAKEFSFSGWYLVSNTGWLFYSAGLPSAVFKAADISGGQQPELEITGATYTNTIVSNTISNTVNTPNQWRHFVVSFKNGKASMYVNGVLVRESISSPGKMPPAFSSFAITNTQISANNFSNGSFDDIMVCNWAIGQTEVDSLYNAPNPCSAIIPITSQPSNVNLSAAGTATFTVATNASGITYQWQRSTDNGSNFTNITNSAQFSGATTATLTVNADTSFKLNKFRCILNNGMSCTGLLSSAASLYVTPPLEELKYNLDLGSASNQLGTGYNGSLINSSIQIADRFGNANLAMRFPANGGINIGSPTFVKGAQKLTVNLWHQKEPQVNFKYLFSKNGDIFFSKIDFTGTFNNGTHGGILASGASYWQSIPDSAWYMRTTVFDNGVLNTYVNGVLVSSSTSSNPVTSSDNSDFIIAGKPSQIAPNPVPAFGIDDVCIVNRVWTPAQIDSVYQATKACTNTWFTQPQNQNLVANGTVTLTAISSVTPNYMRWQVSSDGGNTYTNITNNTTYSGATTNNLTIVATPALDNYRYRLVVNSNNCIVGSDAAIISLTKDVAYNFNDQTPKNILGTNNQGSLSTGVTYVDDRFGNDSAAINIGANNNFMSIGNLSYIDNASSFSFVGWFKKPTNPAANGELFMVKAVDTWTGSQQVTDYLRAYINNGVISASTGPGAGPSIVDYAAYSDINGGDWFQYSYIVDNLLFKSYINGKLYSQKTLTAPLISGQNPNNNYAYVPDGVIIGGYHNNQSASYPSAIDDIYISSKAFTVAQIDSLRNLANPCPGVANNNTSASNLLICNGAATTVSVQNAGLSYKWYDAATGGTELATGISYTTPALTDTTTYFAEASMLGCTTTNGRVPVTVNVKPAVGSPTNATPLANLTLCPNQTTTLVATAQAGETPSWWDAATGGNLLGVGNTYTTLANATSTDYYIGANSGTCTSNTRTQVSVIVDPNKTASLTILPFSCPTNVTGAVYRFPLKVVTPGIVTIGSLTREAKMLDTTTTLVVPNTTYTVNVTDNGCLASAVVTVPAFTPNFDVVTGSACASCAIRNNRTYTFFDDATSRKLVAVNDANNASSLGNIDVCINVDTPLTVGTTTYLGRNFHLTPDTSSTANIRMFFTTAEWQALQAIVPSASTTAVYVTAFDGQQETPNSFNTFTAYGPFAAQADVIAGNFYIDVPVAGFSGFYISGAAAQPLAIADINIAAQLVGNTPLISWSMPDVSKVSSFTLERSTDGSNFEAITETPCNGELKYSYLDQASLINRVYYRVQANLKDHSTKTSSTIAIKLVQNNEVIVWPNPTTGIVHISATDFTQCTVLDTYGRVVITSDSKQIDLSNLSSGQYSLLIRGKKTSTVQKIVKQ
jgi:hypothetical protein